VVGVDGVGIEGGDQWDVENGLAIVDSGTTCLNFPSAIY